MTVECKKHNAGTIRVLCVNLEGSIAGAEQSLLLFVRFAPKTIQISAACPVGVLTDRLKGFGIRTYKILSPPGKSNHIFAWLFYLALVNLQLILIVFKAKPQIIHANSTKAVLAAAVARFFAGSKLIWHMRDLRCSKILAIICGYLSSKIISVSKTVKNKLVGMGVKAELIEVIYNGVAVDDLATVIKEKDQSSPITFANIGQFVPWKRQLFFIEAAERFLQDGLKARFILIGDDVFGRDSKYKNELINKVKVSRFASNIKTIGWQDNMDPYWPQIDCLVHTAENEPFGRVIIEAMAHGVAVIAAESGGPAEIISNGSTGVLFDPDDLEGLVLAMKAICRDVELAQKLAANGRQYIAGFKAVTTAERITKVYEELLAA